MSEIVAPVTPNSRAAASANRRALMDALARWRTAPPGSRIVLPPGHVWLDGPIVLSEGDGDVEFECRGDRVPPGQRPDERP